MNYCVVRGMQEPVETSLRNVFLFLSDAYFLSPFFLGGGLWSEILEMQFTSLKCSDLHLSYQVRDEKNLSSLSRECKLVQINRGCSLSGLSNLPPLTRVEFSLNVDRSYSVSGKSLMWSIYNSEFPYVYVSEILQLKLFFLFLCLLSFKSFQWGFPPLRWE